MDQQQDALDTHTEEELVEVILREVAKANNELDHAEADVRKARRRLNFTILLANRLLGRKKINGFKSSSNKTQTGRNHTRQ
jgi:hypothetical protein